MKIAYFVHDLADPAVRKRVRMLGLGGAQTALLGFRRTDAVIAEVEGVAATDLGQTFDGRLTHRAMMAVKWALTPWRLAKEVRGADVVMARNLEVLLMAAVVRAFAAPRARLVYECLDIHPSMISEGLRGKVLRAVEGVLLRLSALLVVSSPAFVDRYFKPRQHLRTPWLLLENKALVEDASVADVAPAGARDVPGPPWRIGWFGVLRAQKALDVLCDLARSAPGLVEVVIRGRPAVIDFHDFHGQIAATPGVSFGGAYTPDELGAMYADIHFCWTFDFFDEAGNSSWLLPNRIYEGGRFGAVPIAGRTTETGRWVAARDIGLLVDAPVADTAAFLATLTADAYRTLAARSAALDRIHVVADKDECRALVATLGGLEGGLHVAS